MIVQKYVTNVNVYEFQELSSEYQKLIEVAKSQVKNAYAPYSNFQVGAAVELENGEIIGGNNQENSAYPSGVCAERVAMFYANAKYPNVPVKTIVIAAFTNGEFLKKPITPCGACRQVMLETEIRFEREITVILYGSDSVSVIENVSQLLPLSFEKKSLNL